jgi:hypothetical protein
MHIQGLTEDRRLINMARVSERHLLKLALEPTPHADAAKGPQSGSWSWEATAMEGGTPSGNP